MSTAQTTPVAARLSEQYSQVRALSEELCRTLSPEDATLQSMADASPARWHLAHTTWFFETFLLRTQAGLPPFQLEYEYLFNSYYNTVGKQFPRPQRGLISRPSLAEIYEYRQHVDRAMIELIGGEDVEQDVLAPLVQLGLNHEQQHQELILTDIKHALAVNPLHPVYRDGERLPVVATLPLEWVDLPGGVHEIGHAGNSFAYDNESPRHETLLADYQLANRPVACGEFLEFIEAGGYQQPQWWLADGWRCVQEQQWIGPLYWIASDDQHHLTKGEWMQFTLAGLHPIDLAEPVCHISYYEADAFARWAGARLPTEAEWEAAAAQEPIVGNFVDQSLPSCDVIHPRAAAKSDGNAAGARGLHQLFGDVWQWTASPYTAYPGYRPPAGALGEYNGKFMCNQFVLRGGSCATSSTHIRPTYRNFFPPEARWQFSGVRLARDGQ